ncbi:MAG: hypothetical protein AB1352_01880 [Patescibacteria group bacterium]
MEAKRIMAMVLALLVSMYYGVVLSHSINLVTADLGRHIKNGELFFTLKAPLTTNHYSYTYPEFPVTNHHWGSGVLFFIAWDMGGFTGVHLFFIALSISTLLLFFSLAIKQGGALMASLSALLIVPLLSERIEVRPEVFSYFFAGIFFLLLWKYQQGKLRASTLLLLPLLEIAWVNTHIYFFFGWVILGCFALEAAAGAPLLRSTQFKRLLMVIILTLGAAFLNPYGAAVVFQPFTILQNYGYRLAENQPVWFIEKLITDPNFLYFKIIFGILVASFLLVAVKKTREIPAAPTLLAIAVSVMAWLQIRNFVLFGFFALPLIAANIGLVWPSCKTKWINWQYGAALAAMAIMGVAVVSNVLPPPFPSLRQRGISLAEGNKNAAAFMVQNGIVGPMFNNYDIGGYLIYYLFPHEKVFVDNRPEAYAVSFFQEVYVPMQEDDRVWQRVLAQYQFNVIVFSYHDATPWGQRFIIARVKDREWAPVYVDSQVLILLRRNDVNAPIIRQFEIPQEYFRVVPAGT